MKFQQKWLSIEFNWESRDLISEKVTNYIFIGQKLNIVNYYTNISIKLNRTFYYFLIYKCLRKLNFVLSKLRWTSCSSLQIVCVLKENISRILDLFFKFSTKRAAFKRFAIVHPHVRECTYRKADGTFERGRKAQGRIHREWGYIASDGS